MEIFSYTKNNSEFIIELDNLQLYLTAKDYGCIKEKAYLPISYNCIYCTDFTYNGKRFGVLPPSATLAAIVKSYKKAMNNTPYAIAERERKRKERKWDALYNEGADGYNPYRKRTYNKTEPYYKEDF